MDEQSYRQTYEALNRIPCPFEKAVLTRRFSCSQAIQHLIAERETVSCSKSAYEAQCREFLAAVRPQAAFALKLTHLEGPLPHRKELRVQIGSLLGLTNILAEDGVPDVHRLVETLAQEGGVDNIPMQEIIREIAAFQPGHRGG